MDTPLHGAKNTLDRFAYDWTPPVLQPRDGAVERFALIATLSILLGLLVTRVLLHIDALGRWDEHSVVWLAAHRTPFRTHLSLIGSIMSGGVVLPIVAGMTALASAALHKWRVAAFVVFALGVESASYRITTLVIHRHRPRVLRLENLPVNASYPSGHTAASIAVYCGLALLLTSMIRNRGFRVVTWSVAVLMPVFDAWSRLYRGMHHPLDVAGGVVIGIASLFALVLACRASGAASEEPARVRS